MDLYGIGLDYGKIYKIYYILYIEIYQKLYLELIWINRHPVNLEIDCMVENVHQREPDIGVLRFLAQYSGLLKIRTPKNPDFCVFAKQCLS